MAHDEDWGDEGWVLGAVLGALEDLDDDAALRVLRDAIADRGRPRCPACGQIIHVTSHRVSWTECGGEGEGVCCWVADDPCDLHPDGHHPELVAEATAAHLEAEGHWEALERVREAIG